MVYFWGISCFTSLPVQSGLETTIYGVTGLVSIINGGIWYRSKSYYSTFTLNIEWDIDLEEFVVKLPKNTIGGVIEKRVKPENFKQLPREQQDKDCLYYNKANGDKFATVDRGIWYNNGLLYFILQMKK